MGALAVTLARREPTILIAFILEGKGRGRRGRAEKNREEKERNLAKGTIAGNDGLFIS